VVKSDFIVALQIIYREGLNEAFAQLSERSTGGNVMRFMPRSRQPIFSQPLS